MKIGDLCSGESRIWANWWGFQFIIAQTFQLFNVAGYATMEFSMSQSNWDAKSKAYFAMSLISTISYFLVTVGVLLFNCKQQAKAFLVLGTAAFIAQMAIYTTWSLTGTWQFGVGWAGVGNGVVATVYMFLMKNENDGEKTKVASISRLLNCTSFVFYNISYAGFMGWGFDGSWSVFMKSMIIIGVLGFCFLGLATFFSIYYCKQGKMITTALAFCCITTNMGMWASTWVGVHSVTKTNMFACGWVSVGLSLVSLIMCCFEKDQEELRYN